VRLPQNFGDESFKKMHTFKIKEDLKEWHESRLCCEKWMWKLLYHELKHWDLQC
jgi:hypothetical protein